LSINLPTYFTCKIAPIYKHIGCNLYNVQRKQDLNPNNGRFEKLPGCKFISSKMHMMNYDIHVASSVKESSLHSEKFIFYGYEEYPESIDTRPLKMHGIFFRNGSTAV
jgi:hypothetical protein